MIRGPMPRPHLAPALAVVLKGYPRLSETFIAQELLALQRQGLDFAIWSLRHPYDDKTHPMHAEITAPVRYLPEYLHDEPLRVLYGLWRGCRLRGFRRALSVWWADLRRDLSRHRIRRFGQAVVLAAELPAETRFLYAHFLHTPCSVTRYAATIRGLAWGVSAHAKDVWTIPDWEKREKLAEAAFAVTCTAANAAHLGALAPRKDSVSLLYHGLDLSRFPEPPVPTPSSGTFRIVSVGRLVPKKGYDDLLEALALLPASLDWRFVHIGGGPLGARLKARASALGLSSRIDWLGKQDQTRVIDSLRAADLFVLAAKVADDGDRDGLPNVLMEAASQHLPIVATAVSAIPEFVEDGVHGRLVPPGRPDALAAAIAAIARDPDGRRRMALAARKQLVTRFGLDAGIERLVGLLRRGLGETDAARDAA